MPQTVHREIKRYSVTYYGGGKKVTRPYSYRAIIGLWDDAGLISALYFHNDPGTMPDGDHFPDTGQPMSHHPIEDFAHVLDLLRNEKPVYYEHLSNWPMMAGLRTSLEPVGEGEAT